MRTLPIFLIACGLIFVIVSALSAQTLLIDTFEEDIIGNAPNKKWKHLKGNAFDKAPEATVVEDPTQPGNQVYSQTGLRVYGSRDGFKDFTYEFDWMFDGDANVNVAWRIQTATQYYYATRRKGGMELRIFRLDNNSSLLNQGKDKWESQPNVWYTMQVRVEGKNHTVKVKKRDGNRNFDKLNPFAEFEDDNFLQGPVGFWGAVGATLYVDNVIVYGPKGKTENLPFSVQPREKLATVWGALKQ